MIFILYILHETLHFPMQTANKMIDQSIRWCARQGLVRDYCSDSQLELAVAEGINEVSLMLLLLLLYYY